MWPFGTKNAASAPEKRESAPFTDALVSAVFAQASGQSLGDPSALGALEAASGLYAAAFAGAKLSPEVPALSPGCMALIARNLIRRGEDVHQIMVERGEVRLQPIGSWDVRGGPRESNWWYRCDRFGPSGNLTELVPAAAVLHCRYAIDSARSWYGISPLGWARATGRLAANLETRLGEEISGPVGHVIPVPSDGGDGSGDDPLGSLKSDLAGARGRTILAETVAAAWGEGRQAAPQADWKPQRFGANPPATLPSLRTEAAMSVLAACQVPAGLFDTSDGTAQRESWRRWAMGPLAGLAKIVEAELAAKLDQPVRLDFSGLWAHDLAGRASSFKGMVVAGMEIERAAMLSGLVGAAD